ncbi:MAG: hypothetical protein UW34_C0017G0007 [Parcubacteria group bacterium GW2011_GWA2_44_15]|nr:MAG: hypothetical protein UW34_C0017G0007 [Parcubacteria group bacterium GW2011_GWA2_44_15]
MMKTKTSSASLVFIEVAGWYGAFAVIAAYILIQFSFFQTDNLYYQLLNLTGSIGIIADTIRKKDFQPFIINVMWLLVAMAAIVSSIVRFIK